MLAALSASCSDGPSTPVAPAPAPLLPLSWNDVPESLTLQEGESETFTSVLTSAVPADFTIETDSGAVAVTGESPRAGVFEGTVVGLEGGGAARITLTATHAGYRTASASFEVEVEEPPPDPTLPLGLSRLFWDQFGFDGLDCGPSPCGSGYQSYPITERWLVVLPSTNVDFHIWTQDAEGRRVLTDSQVRMIERALQRGMQQFTGGIYFGRITSGSEDMAREGLITIRATDETNDPERWETDDEDYFLCGWASIGATIGNIWLNADRLSVDGEDDTCALSAIMLHELGHALGFFHVDGYHAMANPIHDELRQFTFTEQEHGEFAYELGRGTYYWQVPGPTATSTNAGETAKRDDPRRGPRGPLTEIKCHGSVGNR